MQRTEVIDRIRDVAHKMSPNVQTILYGSEARGDARPDSDIDLLMLVDADKLSYNDKDSIIAPLYDIELDTGIVISALIMPRKECLRRAFSNLYNSRQRGDYDDFVYSTLEEVEELYPKAQTFIEEVDVLLGQ